MSAEREAPLDLNELRRLANEATPGPWDCFPASDIHGDFFSVNRGIRCIGEVNEECDAAFIAAARTAIPALLDEVEALRSRLSLPIPDEVRDEIEGRIAWYEASARSVRPGTEDHYRYLDTAKNLRSWLAFLPAGEVRTTDDERASHADPMCPDCAVESVGTPQAREDAQRPTSSTLWPPKIIGEKSQPEERSGE